MFGNGGIWIMRMIKSMTGTRTGTMTMTRTGTLSGKLCRHADPGEILLAIYVKSSRFRGMGGACAAAWELPGGATKLFDFSNTG